MAIHQQDGKVMIDCPECDHRQAVQKPAGKVHCGRCKMLIDYDTGYSVEQFNGFRRHALLWPDRYRKVG